MAQSDTRKGYSKGMQVVIENGPFRIETPFADDRQGAILPRSWSGIVGSSKGPGRTSLGGRKLELSTEQSW